VSLSLYDSHSQTVRGFEPLVPGKVGIYLCGPTVQSEPHVGHLRSALVYDQLRRWLSAKGLQVTLVRNVTDIDDKVLANAVERGQEWWALAYQMELEFNAAYRALAITPPTYEPRATASIPEMLALIERLIAAGYAYQAEDGSADVYFAASKWAAYGELTNQKIDDMASSEEGAGEGSGAGRGKRDARDFTLWKAAKPGEPASATWQTRFGAGRPGWHIECSAMSTKYLGSQFDIHGGGLDLRFPHHENELAQSRAAGDQFANFWLHNGLVNVAGNKMSKSLGNSIYAADLLDQGSPLVIRYWLGSAHYRSVLDYSPAVIGEAEAALERVTGFLKRATEVAGAAASIDPIAQNDLKALAALYGNLPAAFVAAMDDDLSIPSALAAVYEAVRAGNTAIDAGDSAAVAANAVAVRSMLAVLGIDPLAPEWNEAGADSGEHAALDSLIQTLIAERNSARANKDFARADAIRDQLTAAGIVLRDGSDTTHWSVNG
jgi:cysteinyl-tRNA synthetase